MKVSDVSLLAVKNLTVKAVCSWTNSKILDNISFEILAGKTMALVGESGSGKTITALALLGLLPKSLNRIGGDILFKGNPITSSGNNSFAEIRGKQISMIFQEPISALNPVFKIGNQFSAIIRTHSNFTIKQAKFKVLDCLNEVGFSDPEKIYHNYPHQLSGGMAQRVMIAMALSCRPQLIIADEPTTALDVTTQLDILRLIIDLQQTHNFSLLLISHDMRIVSLVAESVLILKKGQVVYHGKYDQHLHVDKNLYVRSFFDVLIPPASS